MSIANQGYPRPKVDEINAAFLEGWTNGQVRLQHCCGCGHVFFYPRPHCPSCWSSNIEWRASDGRGTVVSFSLVYRPNDPSFFDETPIVLAEVRLTEGPAMLARVICQDAAKIRSGLELELLPPGEAERYPLPTFRPSIQGRD